VPALRRVRLRRTALVAAALVVVFLLAACSGAAPRPTPGEIADGTPGATATPTAQTTVVPSGAPAPPPPADPGAPAPSPPPTALPTSPPAQPASVVLVLTDDLSSDLLPYLPHVATMARAGVTFSHHIVPDSLCCPSRASLLRGQFPHTTGVFTNVGYDGGFGLVHRSGLERSTIATDLQLAGYRTALLGKYLNKYDPQGSYGSGPAYVPPGWDTWSVGGDAYPEFDYDLASHRGVTHHGNRPEDYLTDVLATQGERFVRQAAAAGTPFFLEVATYAPHSPFVPAPRDAALFGGLQAPRTPAFGAAPDAAAPRWLRGRAPRTAAQIAQLDADFRHRAQSVQAIDALLARLQQTLVETGRAANTYVIFTSDNGFHLGQHRLMGGKTTAFDTDVRVPLVVTGPGVPAGRVEDRLTSGVDLRPTLDEVAGLIPGAGVDGHTLLPLWHGVDPGPWRDAALVEHHGPVSTPGDPDLPPPGSGNPTTYEAIRTQTETWVEYADGEVEHYDDIADPDQIHPDQDALTPAHRAALHATLQALSTCHGSAACWAAAAVTG